MNRIIKNRDTSQYFVTRITKAVIIDRETENQGEEIETGRR
jgi:hypothetical protein